MNRLSFFLSSLMLTFLALGALPLPQPEMISASPQAIATHNARVVNATAMHNFPLEKNNSIIKRSGWMDTRGCIWNMSLILLGDWSDLFASTDQNGHWPEHYAKIMLTLTSHYIDEFSSSKEQRQLQYLLFYPRQQALIDLGLSSEKLKELFGQKADPNALVPLECMRPGFKIFDDLENEFITPDCSRDAAGNLQPGRFHTRYAQGRDGRYRWCILQSATLTPDANACYFNYPGFGTLQVSDDQGIMLGGPTQYSLFSMRDNGKFPEKITCLISGGMIREPAGRSVWNYNLNYSGDFLNFTNEKSTGERTFEIGEVHIINTGIKNIDNWEYYNMDFGVLNRFYLLACGTELTYPDDNFNSYDFDPEPVPIQASAQRYDWLRGALYSPAGMEDPYGIWSEMAVEWTFDETSEEYYDIPIITRAPEPYTCIEPAYGLDEEKFAWSPTDALWICENGELTYYPVNNLWQNKPFVMCGTPEGFGVLGTDLLTTTLRLHYDGDIIFHYNPDDYRITLLIPSKGNIDTPDEWKGLNSVKKPQSENNLQIAPQFGGVEITSPNNTTIHIYSPDGALKARRTLSAGITESIALTPGIYFIRGDNTSDVKKILVK